MATQQRKRAHIIVLGNAKGGSGKSTTAMHIIVRLLTLGHRVAAIDLDGRQATLGNYLENRHAFVKRHDLALPVPEYRVITPGHGRDAQKVHEDEHTRFVGALEDMALTHDFVVVDCPGADNFLARDAHALADTLVTPLNDSFIDLDLLARVDPDTYTIISPSWYSEMVWQQRKRRFLQDKHHIDWVVVRNRLSHYDARNKRNMQHVLEKLAPPIGFRLASGLGDRVIYRELFLKGLTLSDLRGNHKTGVKVTMGHIVAHQEVRDLIEFLKVVPGHKRPEAAAG